MIELIIILCAALAAWILCVIISKPSSILYVLDIPLQRSLHEVPKPRTGGITIFCVVFISWLIISIAYSLERFSLFLLAGMALLAIVSYIDDRYSIQQFLRLVAHFVAALFLVLGGLGLTDREIPIHVFSNGNLILHAITIIAVIWVINLYNFMDGIDGLAGGMAVIGFSCFGWFGWMHDEYVFMLMSYVVAASNFGFLVHNFPPAKLFMGDVGSITVGYLVAFYSLWGISLSIFSWWVPIVIFSPFIVDATITLFRRLFAGEKIWEAHKTHYYQRVVQNGWGHKKTAIFGYILMVAVACSVMMLSYLDSALITMYVLSAWLVIYSIIIYLVSHMSIAKRSIH